MQDLGGRVMDGHRVSTSEGCGMGFPGVGIEDSCLRGLPEIWTVAHMTQYGR